MTPEVFWSHVDKSGECWLWTAGTNNAGRGKLRWQGGFAQAHRVAWEMAHGPIPDGLDLCHRCDVGRCVRPDHLFLGTAADNMRDASAKGRLAHGEAHPAARLTAALVRVIRARTDIPTGRFATELGVANNTVRAARARLTWRHVA